MTYYEFKSDNELKKITNFHTDKKYIKPIKNLAHPISFTNKVINNFIE